MISSVSSLSVILLFGAMVLLIVAATVDARTRRIPNTVSLLLLLLFPLYGALSPAPIVWHEHIVTGIIVLALGYGLYLKKWAGAGDVKLFAVLSLWAGPDFFPLFLFVTTIAGGVLCLAVAIATKLRRVFHRDLDTTPIIKLPVSYGVAIATGGLCVLLMLSHKGLS
jgi:prepilin peptidase CpaA